jgi:hypothetical protein
VTFIIETFGTFRQDHDRSCSSERSWNIHSGGPFYGQITIYIQRNVSRNQKCTKRNGNSYLTECLGCEGTELEFVRISRSPVGKKTEFDNSGFVRRAFNFLNDSRS